MSSWTMYLFNCKSRVSAIFRSCYLSRLRWREKYKVVVAELNRERSEREGLAVQVQEREEANDQLCKRLAELEAELERCKSSAHLVALPLGAPASQHTYPIGLVALSVNLARVIGLRRTVRALDLFFNWLDVDCSIPTYQAIRGWMQRIGLARINGVDKVADGIWFVDHTNQIGTEKVLLILRVRKCNLPPPGQPLRHEDMELLCCLPGTQWKQEDVLRVYQEVAARTGHPIQVVTDGAKELQEPIKCLKSRGKSPLLQRDLKHFLANEFERLMNSDAAYERFVRSAGQTRSAVQQTELAPFAPPSPKQKARFMNLKPTLDWAKMTLWHLKHPKSKGRRGISPERMEAKLGWLTHFEPWIEEWDECQYVISKALTFFNENGIYPGSATKFKTKVVNKVHLPCSRKLLEVTVQFIRHSEKSLKRVKGTKRLPISTEILESSFALFKELEQQHAKGGFTSLILVFGTLLRTTTPKEVQQSFARVKVVDVQAWLDSNLPTTVTSKRQALYRESRPRKQQKCATPFRQAA